MGAPTFEWSADKARQNLAKHGVSFSEAVTAFQDPLARVMSDPDHSHDESRRILIGHSRHGNILFVAFAERSDRIRLISARQATRREREDYEEEN